MKLMIAVSAVHVPSFEVAPWPLVANDFPAARVDRVHRVRRQHEVEARVASPRASGIYTTEAR